MDQPDPISIVIDRTPPKELWPNKRRHPRSKEPYIAAFKAAAAAGAQNVLVGREWAWDGPIMLHVEIYWPRGQRRLDYDNAIGALKAAQDGIFAKLGADDRQVMGVLLQQDWDRLGDGYIVYTVEPHPHANKERRRAA